MVKYQLYQFCGSGQDIIQEFAEFAKSPRKYFIVV